MRKTDYIGDKEQRIETERHAAIVVKDGQVLLIYRIKNNRRYYVFPGGHRRNNETGAKTVVRETKEETDITVKTAKLAFEFRDNFLKHTDFYYLCSWEKGEIPRLGGDEKINNCRENFYEPRWVKLEMAESLNILPQFAKSWFLENLTISCLKNCS